MSGDLRVTIDGLSFYGQGDPDLLISKGGFTGWDDSVDMRLENIARPQSHGSLDVPGYQDARTVSLSGHAFADSNAELRRIGQRITGLLADGGKGRVQVDRDGDVQWADGRRASKTKFDEDGGVTADFQIQLWFPDPRKFGANNPVPLTPGVSAPVFHYGNAAATPVITVTGDFPAGYTITGPAGLQYVVIGSLEPGSTHTIDMNHGLLRTNQYYFTGQIGQADVWTIPPGRQITMGLSAPSGSGTATVNVLDTYI